MSALPQAIARAKYATARVLAHIASAARPRRVTAAWRIMRAQASLARWYANREGSIENVISELDAALAVLPGDHPPPSWILGQRLLGEAYLHREAGDPGENSERGIAALEAAQRWATAAAGVDAWTATQSNLGQAYLRHPKGNHLENRARAVAAFEAVMALPFDDGRLPLGWGAALGWLTMIAMVDDDHRYAPRPGMQPHDEALPLDPHWHVPWLLDDAAGHLQMGLNTFLKSGEVPVRDGPEQLEFEVHRLTRLSEMVFQLEERRSARDRTESLFREIRTDGRPFVLFLRGFNERLLSRSTQGVVLFGTGNLESFALTSIVRSASPTPVVWIVNPVESPAINQMVAQVQADAMGHRVEAAEDWEQVARALIAAASFIVMDNESMTPGVVAELDLIREAGRLGDAFFEDVTAANQLFNRTDSRPLDERAFAAISAHTTPRPLTATLPPAMCPWVAGSRRTDMEREAQAIAQLILRLEAEQRPVFRDLMMDACSSLLSCNIMLERREELAGLVARQAALFEPMGEQFADLAAACSQLAKRLQ